MYLQHFGLNKPPFSIAPDVRFLYMTEQHSKALVYMDYAIWNADGLVMITGDIGTGKTTLINKLLQDIRNDIKVARIGFTNLNDNELLESVCHEFGFKDIPESKVERIKKLSAFLEEVENNGMLAVLIVDEAQNLSRENLESLRMLSGLEGRDGPILKVILVGQSELQAEVSKLPQLAQRIKLSFHISPLGKSLVKKYIDFRLMCAGSTFNRAFADDAIDAIYHHTQGVPRLINKVCDAAFMVAFADEINKVSALEVNTAVEEIGLNLIVRQQDKPQVLKDESGHEVYASTNSQPANTNRVTIPSAQLQRMEDAISGLSRAMESLAAAVNRIGDKLE